MQHFAATETGIRIPGLGTSAIRIVNTRRCCEALNFTNPKMNFIIRSHKGTLRENFNTAFPMISANWTTLKNKKVPAKLYANFGDASNDVQLYFRGQGVEIMASK